MLLLYALAISINLARGLRRIDCGCLGSAVHGLSALLPARNLVLVALAGLVLLPVAARPWVWLDSLVTGAGVIALALLYLGANQLIANDTLRREALA